MTGASGTSIRLKNNGQAWETLRKLPEVHSDLLARATRAKEAADQWVGVADSFKVVKEPGKHRARYTVRPATAKSVAKVAKYPTEFANICINAGKG